MKRLLLVPVFTMVLSPSLRAQVRSEADLFGGSDAEVKKADPKTEKDMQKSPIDEGVEAARQKAMAEKPAQVDPSASELIDKMQIGGRLELRANTNKVDDQRYQESPFIQDKTADIYFDTRPNKDTRAFLRLRFYENTSTTTETQESLTTTEKASF